MFGKNVTMYVLSAIMFVSRTIRPNVPNWASHNLYDIHFSRCSAEEVALESTRVAEFDVDCITTSPTVLR